MLDRIAGNGVRCILVESPDRFARDLTVQLTGHDFLRKLGIALIPTTGPDFFTEDTPTAVLCVRCGGDCPIREDLACGTSLRSVICKGLPETLDCTGREVDDDAHGDRLWLRILDHGGGHRALTRQRQRRVGRLRA